MVWYDHEQGIMEFVSKKSDLTVEKPVGKFP